MTNTTLEKIKKIVMLQLGTKEVQLKDHFIEDLGAESIDLVNIIAAVESQFKIEIEEEELPEIKRVHHLLERVQTGKETK